MINLIPPTNTYVYFLIILTFLLSPYFIYLVNYDYKTQKSLSKKSAYLLWAVYGLNVMTIINVAFWSMWPFVKVNIGFSILGATLIILGIFALFLSLREFNSVKKMSGLEAKKIIDTGIYKYSRNPQSLSAFLIIVGYSLIQKSLLALILLAVFFIVVSFFIIPAEEKYLSKMLGEDFVKYKKRVRKWI